MKSYQNHLKTTKSFGEIQSVNYRPTMRSSAVFPLIHKPNKIKSIYTFMGYWLRKRNIPIVTVIATVRTEKGEKLTVRSIEVSSVKSYSLSSSDLIEDANKEFLGSIELEIFSAVDMVFPYPAITFALKGLNGLSFVHTCGRIYNDFEDLKSNNEQPVAETGFDVYFDDCYTPFFCFVNGPLEIKNKRIELEFINEKNQKISKNIKISDVKPYGLCLIKLKVNDKDINKKNFSRCCVKIKHSFEGFFPRFVAGNILRDYEDISLTHSYYDTSSDRSSYAIWKNPSVDKYFDSVVPIPFDNKLSKIELAIYPNFSMSPVELIFKLYNKNGDLLDSKNKIMKIGTNEDKLAYVDFLNIFSKYKKNLEIGMVKMICKGNGTTPSRMKFGLNLGNLSKKNNLPSNICFNAIVPNEKLVKKPGAFHWCSVFDAMNQKIFLHNTSFIKKGFRSAKIEIELCRHDDEKLIWKTTIPYNGTTEILRPKNKTIKKFLAGKIGWLSLSCSTPFISGFYVTDFNKGVIGADHLY